MTQNCTLPLRRELPLLRFLKGQNGIHLLSFLIPAFLLFLSHAAFGVWPFGRYSVLTLDLNAQYVSFFNALWDFVHGEGSLLYSFVRGMGGEFMGIYAYYIASPLSYLVCLFPQENITEAIYLILVLKAGLCGFTFHLLLEKIMHPSPFAAVMLSTAYGLSGYVTAHQSNTMWIDAVYLLPLLVLGLYRLVTEGRPILYTLVLTADLLFNYYIGYMTCIFLLFGFFALYFGLSREKRNLLQEDRHFLRSLGRVAAFSLVAILMSAVMLCPAYYSLTFGKDTFTSPALPFDTLYDPLAYFGKFLLGSFDTIKSDGLPMLYAGLLPLLLFPLFFLAKGIPLREKIAGGSLFLLFVVISDVRCFDLIMHGGQAPNWMNGRYSFFLIFLLLFLVGRLLSLMPKISPVTVCVAGGILILMAAALFLQNEENRFTLSLCLSLPLLIGYTLLLFLYLRKEEQRRVIGACLLAITAVELFASAVLSLVGMHMDVAIVQRDSYTDFRDRFQDLVDTVKEEDPEAFYRTEKTVARKFNDSYFLGYYGLSGSTSTFHRRQIDFLYLLGLTGDSIYTQYCFPNAAADMLLGVKYVMADVKTPISSLYRLVYAKVNGEILTLPEDAAVTGSGDDWFLTIGDTVYPLAYDRDLLVYENPYALSLGFAVSPDIYGLTFVQPEIDENGEWILDDGKEYCSIYTGEGQSVFARLNRMYSAMLGEDVSPFTPVSYQRTSENADVCTTYRSHQKINKDTGETRTESFYSYYYTPKNEEECKVTLTFSGVENQHIYMYIPVATYDKTTFSVNGGEEKEYFGLFQYGIYDLGVFPEGSQNQVTFTVPRDGLHMGKYVSPFFTMEETVLETVYHRLSSCQMAITDFRDDHFTATVQAGDSEKVIFTTIPYDAGWRVTVDGVLAETKEAIDACLSFTVPTGEHTVQFVYFPPIYGLGISLSLFGIALFLFLCYQNRKKRCKNIVIRS